MSADQDHELSDGNYGNRAAPIVNDHQGDSAEREDGEIWDEGTAVAHSNNVVAVAGSEDDVFTYADVRTIYDDPLPSPTLGWSQWLDIGDGEEHLPPYKSDGLPPSYHEVIPFKTKDTSGPTDIYAEPDFHESPIPFVLSPNTAQLLQEYLAANPLPASPPGYEAVQPQGMGVDPSMIFTGPKVASNDEVAAQGNVGAYDGEWDDETIRMLQDYFGIPNDDGPSRQPPTSLVPNSDDINWIPHMLVTGDSDSESAANESDDEDTIYAEDIIRHVWKGINLRYVVVHNGQRLFLSAEQLDERFFGTKSALWGCCEAKNGKRIPQAKLIAHLKKNGIDGFFSEMLWHLLPDVIHYQLIALRRKNRLHEWKW